MPPSIKIISGNGLVLFFLILLSRTCLIEPTSFPENSFGILKLKNGIEKHLTKGDQTITVDITPSDYKARAWLYKNGTVIKEDARRSGNCEMDVSLSDSDIGKFHNKFGALRRQ